MNKVYDYVTQEIIRKLKEEKIAPWQKPWVVGNQRNYITQNPYTGINTLLLSKSGEYLTFNQIKQKKGTLKKGSKSEMVVFFKPVEKNTKNAENETNEKEKYVVLRYYKVFHISDTNLPSKIKKNTKNNNPIENAEEIIKNYKANNKIIIKHLESGRAYYNKTKDYINVPSIDEHNSSEEYYSTMFHEIVHSTGHKNRLDRLENTIFGDKKYSKEELVAEIGASMLSGIAGTLEQTIDNSVSYIDSWIKQLENDNRLILRASALAQKATNYIIEGKTEKNKIKEHLTMSNTQ